MATTIPAAFSKFSSNLEITGLQSSTVSTRQQNIRKHLESELTLLDSFLTGSYSRYTMIAPLKQADIDIFVVLTSSYHTSDGQANLLDRVKRALLKKYTTPEISRSGQAVTMRFDDFMVDVVPAFNRKGGGYLIPNSQGGTWISTNPKTHVDVSRESNAAHDDMLVPLVKMVKQWNRSNGAYFRSFHLEVLAWQILENVKISSYPSAVRYYFDKARAKIDKKIADPSGYNGDVAYYIATRQQIDEATAKLDTAYSRAVKAEEFAKQLKIADASAEWRKVFGDCFPAYG